MSPNLISTLIISSRSFSVSNISKISNVLEVSNISNNSKVSNITFISLNLISKIAIFIISSNIILLNEVTIYSNSSFIKDIIKKFFTL